MDSKIIKYLKAKGITGARKYDTAENDMKLWEQWYKGYVESFHKYTVYNGKEKRNHERKSLNMAAKVCQRWADLLLNEKVEITVADEYTQDVLNELLRSTNFYVRGNNLIERSFALGGGWLVQYWDGKKVSQKYISQEDSLPLSYDSGRVTEIAFVSTKIVNRKAYTYLETHTLDEEGFYVIDNMFLETDAKGNYKEAPPEEREAIDVEEKVLTNSPTPWFQQIKPNIANKADFDNPYGTSVFAGSIDVFKEIDIIFDSYYKEFLLGKKRIFVPDGVAGAMAVDDEGNQICVFDPNDEVFYKLAGQPDENDIHESSMDLRIEEHNKGLQTQLNLLSQQVGFGSNGFKWDENGVTTATGVISQNSELFRTLKKHEILLGESLKDMARALLTCYSQHMDDKKVKFNEDISVNFDDSIIEDTSEIQRRAMLEFQSGLIDEVEYFKRVYKYTDDQAQQFIDTMKARNPIEKEPEPEGDLE